MAAERIDFGSHSDNFVVVANVVTADMKDGPFLPNISVNLDFTMSDDISPRIVLVSAFTVFVILYFV